MGAIVRSRRGSGLFVGESADEREGEGTRARAPAATHGRVWSVARMRRAQLLSDVVVALRGRAMPTCGMGDRYMASAFAIVCGPT